jgi:predicted secreted protein
MPANVGRKVLIKRNGSVIAGARTKSVTINNEAVDVTTDDDSGYRTLLEEPGQKQIDLSVEGLTKDDNLVEAAANGTALIEPYTIELPSGATIEGDFRFNNLELGAEYNSATTFTAEIQSTGSYTFTAAP